MKARLDGDAAEGTNEAGGTTEKDPAQRRVGSVRDAVAILRHLESQANPTGVNRIARTLGLSPSSCFNLLKTLVDEQFVDFDDRSKLYTLGSGAIALGRRALDPAGALGLIRPRLEAVADRHSVTAGLWHLRRGEQLILVGYAECAATFRIQLATGQRLPNASGAGGRCVMAFSGLNDEAIRRRFDMVKWGAAPDFADYLAQVQFARANRWAIDAGNFISGVTTLAAPCLDAGESPEYVVTATLFTGQYPLDRLGSIAEDVRNQAEWLAARLFRVSRR